MTIQTEFNEACCSDTGNAIIECIYKNNLPVQSRVKRIIKITINIFGAPLCFGSTAPHFYVAISLGGIKAVLVTGSVVINFGTLTYWGFICLVNKLLDTPLITRKEDIKLIGTLRKMFRFTLSLFLGMSTRLTSLGILFKMRDRIDRGLSPGEIVVSALLAVLFRSTTTSFSIYESLTYFEKSITDRLFTKKDEKILLIIQSNLASCLSTVANRTIKLTSEERKEQFSTLYEFDSENHSLIQNKKIINSLFIQVLEFSQKTKNEPRPLKDLLYVPKKIVEGISLIAPTALIIQNGLLTYDAINSLNSDNRVGNIAYAVFSALTFCWVGYKYCTSTAGYLFEKTATLLSPDREKSFGEEFYPKTTFILDLLSIILAALTHDEVTEVAKFYVDPKKWWGVVFMEANFAASFLLIVNAMKDLYESGLKKLSETARADPIVREAVILIRKLENLEEIIKLCYLPQLRELLTDMDEETLNGIAKESNVDFEIIKNILDI
jgi:hypothetical protein